MAQRISRASSASSVGPASIVPGDVRTVMRVLDLVFNEGYSGDVDLASEAIRLTRQLAALVDDPEVHGLSPHAASPCPASQPRVPDGNIVLCRSGPPVPAATRDHRGGNRHGGQAASCAHWLANTRAQGAIAALRCGRGACEVADWVQIRGVVRRRLLRFADTPVVGSTAPSQSARPTARARLAAPAEVDEHVRGGSVAVYLHEENGDLELAARLYANAAATRRTSLNGTIRCVKPARPQPALEQRDDPCDVRRRASRGGPPRVYVVFAGTGSISPDAVRGGGEGRRDRAPSHRESR